MPAMTPRRGRGKTATKGGFRKGPEAPKRATKQMKVTKSPTSARAWAVLGLVDFDFDHAKYIKERREALQMRRDVLLVCKAWNEMGKDHRYLTIVITDTSRRYIADLIARFLANPKLAEGVKRFEFNLSINRSSVELVSAMIRGLLRQCPNVEIIDDHVRREASKRPVSPIEIAAQGLGEIPFAVALGNKHHESIEQVRFSKGSTAAFTIHWFVDLMKLLNGIGALCLNDFPAWKGLPIAQGNAGGNNGNSNNDNRRRQGQRVQRRRHDSDEESDKYSSDESEYEEEADDEEEKELEPLEFEYLHTLNMSLIKETKNTQYAKAFTKYLGAWRLPSLIQLSLSIYNVECIPMALLAQVSDQITTLCLHNFSIEAPAPAAPAIDASATNEAGPRTQKKLTALEEKKVVLPKLQNVMVVPNCVSPGWVNTFSTPLVERYILSYFSYSPTPHNPDDYGITPPKPAWSAHWARVRAHLEMILESKKGWPGLREVWAMDCDFLQANTFHSDIVAFWEKWEAKLKAVGVSLSGGTQGVPAKGGNLFPPQWSEARDVWEPGWRQVKAKATEEQRERKKVAEARSVMREAASAGAQATEGQVPVQ